MYPVRHLIAVSLHTLDGLTYTNRIPNFKWPHLVGKAPFVSVVDGDNVVGNFLHVARGISQIKGVEMPHILPCPIRFIDQRLDPFASVGDIANLANTLK